MKLGFFVGAGTVAAVVSACDSAVKKIDTGPPADTAIADGGKADQGQDLLKADASAMDQTATDKAAAAKAATDKGAPDKQPGWDIPLE